MTGMTTGESAAATPAPPPDNTPAQPPVPGPPVPGPPVPGEHRVHCATCGASYPVPGDHAADRSCPVCVLSRAAGVDGGVLSSSGPGEDLVADNLARAEPPRQDR